MHAAVVELDALADAVGTTAEDHDLLLAARGQDLVFVTVARIVIRRECLELGRTGIDETIGRVDAGLFAVGADGVKVGFENVGELRVGETKLFRAAERGDFDGRERFRRQLLFHLVNLAELMKEPRIDLGEIENALYAVTRAEGVAQVKNALGIGRAELRVDDFFVDNLIAAELAAPAETAGADLERTQTFLHRFLKRAADGHRLADGFHRRGERGIGAEEFLKREARDLGDDVVDGRLEARRRDARDVVAQLVERVAHGEFGGDLGDGETGGLRGQGGGTRDARIHLDDDHAAGHGIDGELDVGTAGFDADFANHGERRVTHDLVFFVGERHRRSDGDGVAGVDAHRVKILDGADHHALVLVVTHDLHLVFLPAEQTFLDEDLVHGREIETVGADTFEFFLVVSDPAAAAAEGKGRADDERVGPEKIGGLAGLGHVFHGARFRDIETDLDHALFEQLAVLALVDGVGLGSDHFDAIFGEDAGFVQLHRQIKRGLTAKGGQQGGRALCGDDFLEGFDVERLDVGDIGKLRIGHDRGRVGVHQNDPITLFPESFARLGARVIELAGLPDDDRAGTDDEDGFQIRAFGHERRFRRGLGALKRAASGKARRPNFRPWPTPPTTDCRRPNVT